MAHLPRLIVETFGAAALSEVADRLLAKDSDLRRWLDEVSEPPRELQVHGRGKYTGLLYIVGNRIKRAFLLTHREDKVDEDLSLSYRRAVHHIPDQRGYEGNYADDEFPGFG